MMARGRNSMADIADRVRGGGGRSRESSRCEASAPPQCAAAAPVDIGRSVGTPRQIRAPVQSRRCGDAPAVRGAWSLEPPAGLRRGTACALLFSASGQPSFLEETTQVSGRSGGGTPRGVLADSGGGIGGGGAARFPRCGEQRGRRRGAAGLTAIDSMPTAREMMGIGSEWLRAIFSAPSEQHLSASHAPAGGDARHARAPEIARAARLKLLSELRSVGGVRATARRRARRAAIADGAARRRARRRTALGTRDHSRATPRRARGAAAVDFG